jgi:arginyl-tRNA synthetase
MGVEQEVRSIVAAAVAGLCDDGTLPDAVRAAPFAIERPKRPEHGDIATNAALALQKVAGRPPRELAQALAERLAQHPSIRAVEIAGPGFVNLRLQPGVFHRVLADVLAAGPGYGRAPAGSGERVLLEFVSANPTGPLLISHGRGAIFGDALGRLLEAAGHRVVREYYVNDFGNQVRLLAESVVAAHHGKPAPEGGYGGDYVKELAGWMAENERETLEGGDVSAIARMAISRMLDGVPGSPTLPGIKRTLASLGVRHDSWFSEDSLHRWGRVSAALTEISRRGYIEEADGALFFKAAELDDDKDRVVRKKDGSYTYFAGDIAYHADKVARGFDRLITVLGADHHGYVARVRAALLALGLPADKSEVILYQLVNLLRDGKPYRLGKRLGNLITIEEVVQEIDHSMNRAGAGADALRYFYLSRRNDVSIDLDIEIAKKQSLDNPVFYLQMGYARLCSILRRGLTFGLSPPTFSEAVAERLAHPDELALLGHVGRFPALLEAAAIAREPHQIVFFLKELSELFQSYWTRLQAEGDPILPQKASMAEPGWEERWDKPKSSARLAWVDAIRIVYRAGLDVLGLTALDRLERLEGPTALDGAAEHVDHP